MALISPRLMRELAALDESAMPSTARILRKTYLADGTGGYADSPEAAVNAVPLACRITVSGSGGSSRTQGERIADQERLTVQIALSEYNTAGVEILSTDVLEVTSVTRLSDGTDETIIERYTVVAAPSVGSYSTSLLVPVKKDVGNL